MSLLSNLYKNFEDYFCAFLCGLMILCLIIQVAIRVISGSALAWTEELSRFCFIWTVYVGASLAAKRVAHVRISAQFLLAPVKVRLFFRVIADCVWVAFNIVFVVLSYGMVLEALEFPEVSPTLGWIKGYVEMIIPISFAMMSWRTVEVYIIRWREGTLETLVSIEEEMQV